MRHDGDGGRQGCEQRERERRQGAISSQGLRGLDVKLSPWAKVLIAANGGSAMPTSTGHSVFSARSIPPSVGVAAGVSLESSVVSLASDPELRSTTTERDLHGRRHNSLAAVLPPLRVRSICR